MLWPLEAKFRIAENEDVLAFIERENPSAHDNVASVLTDSANGLPDVQWYCPDVHAYAYMVLHTRDNRIFALAFGMNGLAYRVPPKMIPEALANCGSACSDIGADWVLIAPWPQGGAPQAAAPNHKLWCKIAHDYVAQLKPDLAKKS